MAPLRASQGPGPATYRSCAVVRARKPEGPEGTTANALPELQIDVMLGE